VRKTKALAKVHIERRLKTVFLTQGHLVGLGTEAPRQPADSQPRTILCTLLDSLAITEVASAAGAGRQIPTHVCLMDRVSWRRLQAPSTKVVKNTKPLDL
jgi:hypothetical protein